MSTPDYYAEIDDPVAYEQRWLWISARGDEARAQGCNVTRTEVEDSKLMFKGWKHPSGAPPRQGVAMRAEAVRDVNAALDEARQARGMEMGNMVDLEPYPALSPNRMYGDCLRFIYKDGKFVLQQRWIIPQEGLRVPQFEWRDVVIADATEP